MYGGNINDIQYLRSIPVSSLMRTQNLENKEDILAYMFKELKKNDRTYFYRTFLIGTEPNRKAIRNFDYLADNGYIIADKEEYDDVIKEFKLSPYLWRLTEKGMSYARQCYKRAEEKKGYKWK